MMWRYCSNIKVTGRQLSESKRVQIEMLKMVWLLVIRVQVQSCQRVSKVDKHMELKVLGGQDIE